MADAAAHGLHRWQQGFNLEEVARELGLLNECVVIELEQFARLHPAIGQGAMAEGRRIWAALYSVAISASTSHYFRLQQLEAAGHVADLERALVALQEFESRRAELWQQAAHDMRGNLGVVFTATAGLAANKASAEHRADFLGLLDRNVRSLHRLLEDVTSLARLQGGQERRVVAPFDASIMMGLLPSAQERGLFPRIDGPPACAVDGDEIKTRRVVQNLAMNAVKYTTHGGVTVRWGQDESADPDRWFIDVQDTGPGFNAGRETRVSAALAVATDQSKDLDADAIAGDITHVSGAAGSASPGEVRLAHPQPGEGIGLSIVKRLCELLEATIDLDSKPGTGTTVRIHLPRRYGS
jgi:signal transduction histidine kinase